MRPMKTITDPESFQLLADETRRKIIYLLRVKEMTVGQLAQELNLTPQAVYHHVKKLVKGGMLEVAREERCCSGHMIESYYRTTAEVFSLSVGKARGTTSRDHKIAVEQAKASLEALKKLGFKIEYTDDQVSKLIDLEAQLAEKAKSGKFEDAIANLDELDLVTRLSVSEYAGTLSMTDDEFKKKIETQKKLREMLLSLVTKA